MINPTSRLLLQKELLLRDILKNESAIIELWHGSENTSFDHVAPAEQAGPGALAFASTQEQLMSALNHKASVIVVDARLTPPPQSHSTLLKCPQVGIAMNRLLPFFDRKLQRFDDTPRIHPTSVIHPSAQLADDVRIGALSVIGPRVQIGTGSVVGSQVTIELEARIGERCLLHPQVFIGAQCIVGNECEIHPHTTVGSDGFGYARDKRGQQNKLPQLGHVVIGNRVEIGANCAIDRAAFLETRIADGTKIDNLCHIGHNVEIGQDGVLAAGLMVAGSTKIGDRFMCGGMVAVSDHVQITNDVILAGRSTVTNDISQAGAFGGYPLLPLKEHLKNLASSTHMTELRKSVARILKTLNLDS